MICTTVITTYNRVHCVGRAIRSALTTLPMSEVIVVDDASQDDTLSYVKQTFPEEIANGRIKLVALEKNLGVTGAKNAGYVNASGDWVVFLDSDDEYFQDAGPLIEAQLVSAAQQPIVFFRCRDHIGKFVGLYQGEELQLNLATYLQRASFGETLPAVNKRIIGKISLYPTELRGYEGLGYCRLIQQFGPALLSQIVARTYHTEGDDRLSISHGFFNRMPLLARGHLIMVKEFWRIMKLPKSLGYLAKAAIYFVLGNSHHLLKKILNQV